MAFDLGDYVTVNQRLKLALERWPELRIQETAPNIVQIGDRHSLEITTTVWRDPEDPLPAIASCWEPWPGTTPYTKGSEQQNASTSSLGRCLGMMGVAIERGIASADEVAAAQSRSRHPSNTPESPQEPRKLQSVPDTPAKPSAGIQPASEKQLGFLRSLAKRRGVTIGEAEWETLAADKRAASRKIEELNQA